MSTCGLYGQVESVTDASSVVRLINDANSSVAAMVQNSRAHGILHGAYDGTLTLEYVPIDMTVGEGDIVIASGSGGVYPRGIVIGTVRTIETDSSKLYHRIIVEPLFNIESCEEVARILTGNETETGAHPQRGAPADHHRLGQFGERLFRSSRRGRQGPAQRGKRGVPRRRGAAPGRRTRRAGTERGQWGPGCLGFRIRWRNGLRVRHERRWRE